MNLDSRLPLHVKQRYIELSISVPVIVLIGQHPTHTPRLLQVPHIVIGFSDAHNKLGVLHDSGTTLPEDELSMN